MVAVIEVRASSSIGTEAVNVWHWRIPEANSLTELTGIIGALDAFYEAIKAELQAGIITVEGLARTVDQNPNEYISGSGLTTLTTGSGASVLSACAVLSLKSNTVGGSRRGRKYLGPLDTAAVATNGADVATSTISTILTAATTLMGFTTNGVELGVWSRKFQTFTPVSAVGVATGLGTQRRRLT